MSERIVWSKQRARLYNAALQYSNYPAQVMGVLAPLVTGCRSALDVGAGVGALTLPPHDLLLVANVPHVLDDVPAFVTAAARIAQRLIVLVQHVETGRDKFYLDELHPLLLGTEYRRRRDYLDTYVALHRLGIHADVKIIEYDFDQPFTDLAEAVVFWKAHLPVETAGQEARLKRFLQGRLRPVPGGLLAPIHRKSAVLSWPLT